MIQMRDTIGSVKCPFHTRRVQADVRRDKNGKLYYNCPSCGPVHPHGNGFREWILSNARLDGAKENAA